MSGCAEGCHGKLGQFVFCPTIRSPCTALTTQSSPKQAFAPNHPGLDLLWSKQRHALPSTLNPSPSHSCQTHQPHAPVQPDCMLGLVGFETCPEQQNAMKPSQTSYLAQHLETSALSAVVSRTWMPHKITATSAASAEAEAIPDQNLT